MRATATKQKFKGPVRVRKDPPTLEEAIFAAQGFIDDIDHPVAASLSREAGLYTAHEMMEGLDPRYQSSLVIEMLEECARLLAADGAA